MCRIPRQNKARSGDFWPPAWPQRPAKPRSDKLQIAETAAEGVKTGLFKMWRVGGKKPLRLGIGKRPDKRHAMAVHRHQRERTARQETLIGGIVMMRLRLQDGDDGGLGPPFLARGKPGILGKAAVCPVAGNDEPGTPLFRASVMPEQLNLGVVAKIPPRGQGTFLKHVDLPVLRCRGESGMKRGIADHVTHRRVGGVPAEFEWRTPSRRKTAWRRTFGNGKPADRRRCRLEPVPDAKRRQHAGAGGIDRRRALVPGRDAAASAIDKHDPVAGVRQRRGGHQARQPATDDGNVMHHCLLRRRNAGRRHAGPEPTGRCRRTGSRGIQPPRRRQRRYPGPRSSPTRRDRYSISPTAPE